MIRLAVIGLGRWAREAHLALLSGESVELAYAGTQTRALARELGFSEAGETWREALSVPR